MKKLVTSFLLLAIVMTVPLSVSAIELESIPEPEETSISASCPPHDWKYPLDPWGNPVLGGRATCKKCGARL